MGWRDNPDYTVKEVTIANGAQESTAVDLGSGTLCGVIIPGTFTGTVMTFLAVEDSTSYAIYDAEGAADYSIAVAASKFVPVDTTKFVAVRNLKVKSWSVEGGARTVKLVTRKFQF
jgi:hypothetical protein